MILIFTDYGLNGPYLGQVHAVLNSFKSDHDVITLMPDAPRFNPRASAYLLPAITRCYPEETVIFAVIDPGVGGHVDRPVIIRADGRWFVGPDNGLFDILVRQSDEFRVWEIEWSPEKLSQTFHGRDLYAPVCGMLAEARTVPGREFSWHDTNRFPDELFEVIYVDDFGNLMTGIHEGIIDPGSALQLAGVSIKSAGYFSQVKEGEAFWHVNSIGLVEIAVNQGSAAKKFTAGTGDEISVV